MNFGLRLSQTEALVKLFDYIVDFYPTFILHKSDEVSDFTDEKLSFKERLFSKPWQPFKTSRKVYAPSALIEKDKKIVLVSPKTYNLFVAIAENEGKTNC